MRLNREKAINYRELVGSSKGGEVTRVARGKKARNQRSGNKPPVAMTQSSINGSGEIVLYEAPDGEIRLDVRLDRDTVWLTQVQMGKLFDKNVRTILEQFRGVGRFFSYPEFPDNYRGKRLATTADRRWYKGK